MSVDDAEVEMISDHSRSSTPSIAFSTTPSIVFPTFCIDTNYDMSLPENKEPDYLRKGRERNRYRVTQKERKKALSAEVPETLEDLRNSVS